MTLVKSTVLIFRTYEFILYFILFLVWFRKFSTIIKRNVKFSYVFNDIFVVQRLNKFHLNPTYLVKIVMTLNFAFFDTFIHHTEMDI